MNNRDDREKPTAWQLLAKEPKPPKKLTQEVMQLTPMGSGLKQVPSKELQDWARTKNKEKTDLERVPKTETGKGRDHSDILNRRPTFKRRDDKGDDFGL